MGKKAAADPIFLLDKCFRVTDNEYRQLNDRYGKLSHAQAWEYNRRNSGFCMEEREDVVQELCIALMTAGSYYKRQVYVDSCLEVLKKYVKDIVLKSIVDRLDYLWSNKTKHGAGKRRFGKPQEVILDKLVNNCVPPDERPSKTRSLQLDAKFGSYCKAITWNRMKNIGIKSSREKEVRAGEVSIADYIQ
jgi:hypothetical protein